MSPESFNAQLAIRKLEAVDILLIQAKRGSDPDRIRAASAILRIAFMTEPKPQKAAPEPPVAKDAPESPQQSEEIPGDPPEAPAPAARQLLPHAPSPIAPSPIHTSAARTLVNSS